MNEEFDVENIKKRMNGALESVKNDFKSLRTGRASSSILDNITVAVSYTHLTLPTNREV